MMTPREGKRLAVWVRDGLPYRMKQRLKAIHVMPKLHDGHLTVRVFMVPQTAEDPEAMIFSADEL